MTNPGECAATLLPCTHGLIVAIDAARTWEGATKTKHEFQMSSTLETKITAADVVAWFESFIPAEYAGKIAVGFDTGYHKQFCAAPVPYESGGTKFADSPNEAVAIVLASIKSPEQLAAQKREEAAKLLAEADALAPQPAEAVA